jgi:hypothetical protein
MNNIYRTKGMKHIFPYIFDIDFVNGDFFFPVWMEERTILSHWWRKGLYCLIDGGKDYTVSLRKFIPFVLYILFICLKCFINKIFVFFWSLCCLFFFDVRILQAILVTNLYSFMCDGSSYALHLMISVQNSVRSH